MEAEKGDHQFIATWLKIKKSATRWGKSSGCRKNMCVQRKKSLHNLTHADLPPNPFDILRRPLASWPFLPLVAPRKLRNIILSKTKHFRGISKSPNDVARRINQPALPAPPDGWRATTLTIGCQVLSSHRHPLAYTQICPPKIQSPEVFI